MHCDCVGTVVPASQLYEGTAPSTPTTVGSAQATLFETAPVGAQVQVAGQSVSAVHVTAMTWQDDVESVVVVQESPVPVPASCAIGRSAPVLGGDDPDPSKLPDADPVAPPPEHSV